MLEMIKGSVLHTHKEEDPGFARALFILRGRFGKFTRQEKFR